MLDSADIVGAEKINFADTTFKEQAMGNKTNRKIILSPRAREISTAKTALDRLPDIRQDRVAEIKRRVEDGSYSMDSRKIACGMIKDVMLLRF